MRRVAAVTDRSATLGDAASARRADMTSSGAGLPRPELEAQGRLVQEQPRPPNDDGAVLARAVTCIGVTAGS